IAHPCNRLSQFSRDGSLSIDVLADGVCSEMLLLQVTNESRPAAGVLLHGSLCTPHFEQRIDSREVFKFLARFIGSFSQTCQGHQNGIARQFVANFQSSSIRLELLFQLSIEQCGNLLVQYLANGSRCRRSDWRTNQYARTLQTIHFLLDTLCV